MACLGSSPLALLVPLPLLPLPLPLPPLPPSLLACLLVLLLWAAEVAAG
jgi:hypothetical protein